MASSGDGFFEELADFAPVLIWRAGTDSLCHWFNKPWLEFTGRSMEQETGNGWAEGVHPDDFDQCLQVYVSSFNLRQPFTMTYRLRRHDGEYRQLLDNGKPYFQNGQFAGYFGSCVDVTDLNAMEAQLRQSQKMEAVGQLTGGVAHDFNNLLTVIKSSSDLLKRPNLSEERRIRYIAAISDTVDRAAKLTSQLLAFSRRQTLKPKIFAAGESIRSLKDMLQTLSGSHIRIFTELSKDHCFLSADPSQFETAIVNMAINARDAMNGNGVLTIRVEPVEQMPERRSHVAVESPFVAVSVGDTGSGIPPEQLDRIFEPFFTTKEVGQGTGLGLSQVIGFSKQTGGDVIVESEVGQGTTFTLYLPRLVDGIATIDESEAPLLEDGQGATVLVVEDNETIGLFAVQTLQDLGFHAILVTDGCKALQELAKRPRGFDVVFTDVVMPGMSGIELAHEIRRVYPDVPVVLATGYSHITAERGTHGFDLVINSYSVEDLSRQLRQAMSRTGLKRA